MPLSRRGMLAGLWAIAAGARAEPPLRIVVAYPTGGLSDSIARALAARLAVTLATPVQVVNQPGAGGAIALRALARDAPDGRTLVYCAVTPIAYDPPLARGLAPVAGVMLNPSIVVGTPAFAGRDFADLLAQARQRPGALRWATSGVATTGHLVLEQVCAQYAIEVTHVPYKGGGQQITDALSGQFELLTTNAGPLQLGHVRRGRLRPLAVGAPRRLAMLADVPTLAELGCPRGNLASLFGLYAPAGTPRARIDVLNAAVNAALAEPALHAVLEASGNLPWQASAEAFGTAAARATQATARLLRHE